MDMGLRRVMNVDTLSDKVKALESAAAMNRRADRANGLLFGLACAMLVFILGVAYYVEAEVVVRAGLLVGSDYLFMLSHGFSPSYAVSALFIGMGVISFFSIFVFGFLGFMGFQTAKIAIKAYLDGRKYEKLFEDYEACLNHLALAPLREKQELDLLRELAGIPKI